MVSAEASAGPHVRPTRTTSGLRRPRTRCPADDLVDVAVGRPVVVPGRVAVDLGLAEVERTPGGQQGGPSRGEVLHQVADARRVAEERVVVLGRSVDVDLGPVGQGEPDRPVGLVDVARPSASR